MIGQVSADYATLVMMGERIHDSLKSGKLVDIEALQTMVKKR